MIRYLNQAIKEANNDTDPTRAYRFAVIGVRYDGAIVRSRNLSTKTPEHRAHAESRIVRKLDVGAVIYIARVLKDGNPALARPCKKCQNVLRAHGIKKAYFTIGIDEWGCMEFPNEKGIIENLRTAV